MPERTDQCFEMAPRQRWKGLWQKGFEDSRFCPSPANACSFENPGDSIWLSEPDKDVEVGSYNGDVYEVEFIGRRTSKRGRYGHFGEFDHEIVVDKMIMVRRVKNASAE